MDNTDDLLRRIEAREADPAWQEQQRREQEVRAAEVRRATAAGQRELLAKLLPEKVLEELRAGKVDKTPAIEALEQAPPLVVLSGGTGTGKTTAAGWWLYTWVMDPSNWSAVDTWGTAPRLMGSAIFVTGARLARWARYDDGQMDKLLRASRLVIDDLGGEFMDVKGAFLSLIDEIINERYANRRPTVLTTNFKVEDFRERYEARIADRIRELGKFIALGNVSMRGGAGAPRPVPKQEPLSIVRTPPPDAVKPAPPGLVDRRMPRERDDDDEGKAS